MITRRKLLLRSALAAPALILPSRSIARPMHGKPSGGGGGDALLDESGNPITTEDDGSINIED